MRTVSYVRKHAPLFFNTENPPEKPYRSMLWVKAVQRANQPPLVCHYWVQWMMLEVKFSSPFGRWTFKVMHTKCQQLITHNQVETLRCACQKIKTPKFFDIIDVLFSLISQPIHCMDYTLPLFRESRHALRYWLSTWSSNFETSSVVWHYNVFA